MSEGKSTATTWTTFSATPEIIDAVQYVVIEKDGKKFSNFQKIIKRPHINGRINEGVDYIRVSTKDGREQLRPSYWLVVDRTGDLSVYKDEDFHKLFESGSPVATEGSEATDNALSEAVKKLQSEFSSLLSAVTESSDEEKKLSNRLSEAEKEISAMSKQITFMKKGADKNVKSKTSKS